MKLIELLRSDDPLANAIVCVCCLVITVIMLGRALWKLEKRFDAHVQQHGEVVEGLTQRIAQLERHLETMRVASLEHALLTSEELLDFRIQLRELRDRIQLRGDLNRRDLQAKSLNQPPPLDPAPTVYERILRDEQ